ncbi:MAG: rRNA pseudouridine synthase [Armatimonadetes bacterium]|nr:rRNA pseudouridine synthase [Armatimonadota bacterium]
MRERLAKVLAKIYGSRRKCEKLILDGLVKINGKAARELWLKVDPFLDEILVSGHKIIIPRKVYILLNKPKGFICSLKDPERRPRAFDLIKDLNIQVFNVGRLDYDSEGLLLFTNDGELAYRLTHPKYKIKKVYQVKINGVPGNDVIKSLSQGIKLEGEKTIPCKIKFLRINSKKDAWLEVILFEGRNRQIRKMFEKFKYPVISLKRIALGNLSLRNLPSGKYRFLNFQEVNILKKSVGL